ncbi:MAG: CehA/McbA family metallohydrolase [Acidobacteriaceae bacterium]
MMPMVARLLMSAMLGTECRAQTDRPEMAEPKPSLVLRGTVKGSQNNTYLEVPFVVPPGTHRVTLAFAYTGKEQRTTFDLGMLDPEGLRCWSGGNKSLLTVSRTDATPSCLPGPIGAGTWKVLIGIPNIRPAETATYTASLFFKRTDTDSDETRAVQEPIRKGAAWYRGDLHIHTAHSDGSCNSVGGKKVPCPVFVTVDAAMRQGLDFLAITDHNTTSHFDAMRELAPYFDTLLLIPGREITTFHGHANVFGTREFIDFRLGSSGVPDVNTILRQVRDVGGMVSLNHPNAPSGEACMGCGWTPSPAADMSLVQAVEAINSGAEDGPYSGIPFWDAQLNAGHRLTGIGGSDNHTPQKALAQVGAVGSPTTVVYAAELSTPAVLAGLRAGHVFVDLTATKGRVLEVRATTGQSGANMGDLLAAPVGSDVMFSVHTTGADGASLAFVEDGRPMAMQAATVLHGPEQVTEMSWKSDGQRHWIRAEVRGADGKLWLLGNPVYLNWPGAAATSKGGN